MKNIVIFFKSVALFLFMAQKIKIAQVIKYHQKKALFKLKKDFNFIWVQCRTTAQLSVKGTQCRIAKYGLVLKGANPSGPEVVKQQNQKLMYHAYMVYVALHCTSSLPFAMLY